MSLTLMFLPITFEPAGAAAAGFAAVAGFAVVAASFFWPPVAGADVAAVADSAFFSAAGATVASGVVSTVAEAFSSVVVDGVDSAGEADSSWAIARLVRSADVKREMIIFM